MSILLLLAQPSLHQEGPSFTTETLVLKKRERKRTNFELHFQLLTQEEDPMIFISGHKQWGSKS